MEGLSVKCKNCGRTDFITTDKYDPDVSPRGDMLKCTLPYHIDFLLTSTTGASSLTCPECMAQLAPSGRLTVIAPEPEPTMQEALGVGDEVEAEIVRPRYICDVCGKGFKVAGALNGHKKSHKKEE